MTVEQLEPALAAIRRSPYPYVTEPMLLINGGRLLDGAELPPMIDALLTAKVLSPATKDGRMAINQKALAVLCQKQASLFD